MTPWPAMMRREKAAQYCDLSVAEFEREVVRGNLPAPAKLGRKDHWHKESLDRALARIAGLADTPDYRAELERRYGAAA